MSEQDNRVQGNTPKSGSRIPHRIIEQRVIERHQIPRQEIPRQKIPRQKIEHLKIPRLKADPPAHVPVTHEEWAQRREAAFQHALDRIQEITDRKIDEFMSED